MMLRWPLTMLRLSMRRQPEYIRERWGYADSWGLSLICLSAGQAFSRLID